MNDAQELWWLQARSDHAVFVHLRRLGADSCHQLHYMQMVTEKISKAYFWRSGYPPVQSHIGFVPFLRMIGTSPTHRRRRVTDAFGYKRFRDFRTWISSALPLAYSLERIVPALAADGPNPEYPWPHEKPVATPCRHRFEVWNEIVSTPRGRELVRVMEAAVRHFPAYA